MKMPRARDVTGKHSFMVFFTLPVHITGVYPITDFLKAVYELSLHLSWEFAWAYRGNDGVTACTPTR